MTEDDAIAQDPDLIERVNEICKGRHPINHIKAMDYPRMAGTSGSDRGVEYISTAFKNNGFEPKIEEFFIPPLSKIPKLILPLAIIAWGVFSACNVFLISGIWEVIFNLLILMVPVILFLVIFKLEIIFKKMINGNFRKIQNHTEQIKKGRYKGPIKKGKNVYVVYEPEDYEEHLYLTAHHDTTTLKLKMKYMKLAMLIGILSGMIYILSYLIHFLLETTINYLLFDLSPAIFIIILIIFLVSISLVLINRIIRTNESHGAIDNATGTSLILELAEIAKITKSKLKITFIAFAAEEIGFFGSTYHYHAQKEYFETHKIHAVSIDMIGEIPPLTLIEKIKPVMSIPMDTEFNDAMENLAQKLGIEIQRRPFLYPGSDFAVWLLNGHSANWVENGSKYIHSAEDVAVNVNEDLLNDCLKLFTAYFLLKSG